VQTSYTQHETDDQRHKTMVRSMHEIILSLV
jgi:hypothetical protein